MRHTFWSCLIRYINTKWIQPELSVLQSGHGMWGGRTDRQTDWQTDGSETNIPPNNFVVRGYNEVKFQLMRSTVVFCETQLSACICAEMQGNAQDKDQDLSESIMVLYLFNMQIYNAVTQSKGVIGAELFSLSNHSQPSAALRSGLWHVGDHNTTMESELWCHNIQNNTMQSELWCHNIQYYTTMQSELWCHNIQYYTTMQSELWLPQHSELHNNAIWAMVATTIRITQQCNLSYGATTFSITQQWNLSYGCHNIHNYTTMESELWCHSIQNYTTMESELWCHNIQNYTTMQSELWCHNIKNYTTMQSELWCHNIQNYTTMQSELWWPQHSELHHNAIWAMVATTFRITPQCNLSYGGHNIQNYTTMQSELWWPQHSELHHNAIWAMVATTFRITQQWNLSYGGHNIQNYTTMQSELWWPQQYNHIKEKWPQHSVYRPFC